MAASNAVPSKPVYGFAPLTVFFQYAANALPAGPPAALPADAAQTLHRIADLVQRLRVPEGLDPERLVGAPLPAADERRRELLEGVREVDDHPSRWIAVNELPGVRVEVRLLGVPGDRGADRAAEPLPLGHEQRLQRLPERVVPRPDVELRALAELRQRRPASTLLWSASDGYARNTRPLSLRTLICGALDVGETRRTLFGNRHRLGHRDRGARRHLSDDHVRLVHLDELRRGLDGRRCLRLPVLRPDERDRGRR